MKGHPPGVISPVAVKFRAIFWPPQNVAFPKASRIGGRRPWLILILWSEKARSCHLARSLLIRQAATQAVHQGASPTAMNVGYAE